MIAEAPDGGRGQAPRRHWATPWAWATHRDTITRLYMEDGLTLPEVARIMSRDHGFHSSPRMFKHRFRCWGLHKYRSHRHDLASGQESTGKVVRSAQTSPALPLSLEPPESFRVPEVIARLTEVLVARELAGGVSHLQGSYDSFAAAATTVWFRSMRSSVTLIALGEHHEGFQALNHCMDACSGLLQPPSLDLFATIFVGLLVLPPEIGKRLLVFGSNMASVSLPLGHPFRLIATTMRKAGYQVLWDNAWLIFWSHVAVLKRRLGTTNPTVLNLYTELSDGMMLLHSQRQLQIDLDVFATEQTALMEARRELGDDLNLALGQLSSGYHYWRRGDLAAADAVAKDVLARCSADRDGSPLNRIGRHAVEIQWGVAMENYDRRRRAPGSPPLRPAETDRLFEEALRLGREYARLQLLEYGPDSAPVRETAARMRAFCKKADRPDAMKSMTPLRTRKNAPEGGALPNEINDKH